MLTEFLYCLVAQVTIISLCYHRILILRPFVAFRWISAIFMEEFHSLGSFELIGRLEGERQLPSSLRSLFDSESDEESLANAISKGTKRNFEAREKPKPPSAKNRIGNVELWLNDPSAEEVNFEI